MGIEKGVESLNNNLDIQTEISDFFEGLGIDKEETKEFYEAMLPEEKEKFNRMFEKHKDNPDFEAEFSFSGLPYDNLNTLFELYLVEENKDEKNIIEDNLIKQVEKTEEIKDEKIKQVEKTEEIKDEKIKQVDFIKLKNKEKINEKINEFKELKNFQELVNNGKIDENATNDEIVDYLSNNFDEVLTSILQEGNKEEFTKVLDIVSDLQTLSPDKFNNFDKKYYLELSGVIPIPFISGNEKIEKDGNTITSGDQKIKLDEIPPVKYITSRRGYNLESTNIPNKEINKNNKEIFHTERKGVRNDRNINIIENKKEAIKSDYDYVKNISTFSETDLNKFYSKYIHNTEIKSKIEAVTDDINNPEAHKELKSLLLKTIESSAIQLESELQKLKETKKEIEEKLKELKEEKDRNLKLMQEKVKEEDKKAREIRDFISSTGFDLLPQSLTDQLIRELKMNSLDIPGFKIDYTNIDISEGKFGESPTETDAIKWKENLMLFMNKAIYGEFYHENSIIDPAKFIGPMGARVNPTEFNSILEMQGIKTKTGFDISQIRENLKKVNK